MQSIIHWRFEGELAGDIAALSARDTADLKDCLAIFLYLTISAFLLYFSDFINFWFLMCDKINRLLVSCCMSASQIFAYRISYCDLCDLRDLLIQLKCTVRDCTTVLFRVRNKFIHSFIHIASISRSHWSGTGGNMPEPDCNV